MKFAIVGTHNTGKTTAVWQVAANLKRAGVRNVGVVPEIVRGCPYPVKEKATLESANWTMLNQILAETDAQLNYKHIILDRSVIDQIIYFETVCPDETQREYLRTVASAWLKISPYKIFFLFTSSDEVMFPRKSSLAWRDKVEEGFLEHFKYVPNVYFPLTATFDDRVREITDVILQEIANEPT